MKNYIYEAYEVYEKELNNRHKKMPARKRLKESITEARNPENDEVNAIIKNKLGKGQLSKKEQEVLDRYGITRDEYKDFVGPNGKKLTYRGGKEVQGPTKPETKYGRKDDTIWDLGKSHGYARNPKSVKSFNEVDFANYLTKETDPTARAEEERRKANAKSPVRRFIDKSPVMSPEERKALHPYSDDYKDAMDVKSRHEWDVNYHGKNLTSDEEIDKELDELRQEYERSIENKRTSLKNMQQYHQANYNRALKDVQADEDKIEDIKNRARAKHAKNESLNSKTKFKEDYKFRHEKWELENFTEEFWDKYLNEFSTWMREFSREHNLSDADEDLICSLLARVLTDR